MESGDASGYQGDRSAVLLGIASSLTRRGFSREEVMSTMAENAFVWQTAVEHSNSAPSGGCGGTAAF
jgi:hypothetical protein